MPGARILVIDDNHAVRGTITRVLNRNGYEVLEATNGREGLKLFDDSPFALVLTDIIMPDQEGIETLIAIKKRRPDTKVVAMSGGGRLDHRDLLHVATRLGADAVLPKPFSLDELLQAIVSTLASD